MQDYQPPFWLKIRKDYVYGNFEAMADYLRRYNFNPLVPNPEFLDTLKCLEEMTHELLHLLQTTPPFRPLELPHPTAFYARLLGVFILAEMKRKVSPRVPVLTLFELMLRARGEKGAPLVSEDVWDTLWKNTMALGRRAQLRNPGFTWADLADAERFNLLLFINKLPLMVFSEGEDAVFLNEEKGLAMLTSTDQLMLSSMRPDQINMADSATLYDLDGDVSMRVPRKEAKRVKDFPDLVEACLTALREMARMRAGSQSAAAGTGTGTGDLIPLRVHRLANPLVVGVTLPGMGEEQEGKVWFEQLAARPNIDVLRTYMRVDDLIVAQRSTSTEFAFDVTGPLEDFYRRQAQALCGKDIPAVLEYSSPQGMQWVTADGVRLFVHKNAQCSQQERDHMEQAADDGRPCMLRAFYKPNIGKDGSFSMYANVSALREQEHIDDHEPFTLEDADKNFMDDFLSFCEDEFGTLRTRAEKSRPIEPDVLTLLSRLLFHMAENLPTGPTDSLKFITSIWALAQITDQTQLIDFLKFRLEYLRRRVAFAAGGSHEDGKPLQVAPSIKDIPEVAHAQNVLEELSQFRNPSLENAGLPPIGQADLSKQLAMLVHASNSLSQVISMSELSNVKLSIARLLGVEEAFRPLLPNRTYYGQESDSLELKSTLVFPPLNRRRSKTIHADPDLQKWAILKAVCAMLNSRSGGDVLIGVDDRTSFACGVEQDIQWLFQHKFISTPNMDHYTVYVRNIINYSFRRAGEEEYDTDITKPNIDYITEKSEEGIEILRLHIRPYRQAVVEIGGGRLSEPPAGYSRSYVRTHGASEPVTEGLLARILTYKDSKK